MAGMGTVHLILNFTQLHVTRQDGICRFSSILITPGELVYEYDQGTFLSALDDD